VKQWKFERGLKKPREMEKMAKFKERVFLGKKEFFDCTWKSNFSVDGV
jgi:hypothetical protein